MRQSPFVRIKLKELERKKGVDESSERLAEGVSKGYLECG